MKNSQLLKKANNKLRRIHQEQTQEIRDKWIFRALWIVVIPLSVLMAVL